MHSFWVFVVISHHHWLTKGTGWGRFSQCSCTLEGSGTRLLVSIEIADMRRTQSVLFGRAESWGGVEWRALHHFGPDDHVPHRPGARPGGFRV